MKDTTYPLIFEAAYAPGTIVRQSDNTYKFNVYSPGKITLSSGKIIACDPIVMHDAIPFTQKFPQGQYPVELAIAGTKNSDLIAFARINFSNSPVAEWKYALQADQTPLALTDSDYYCFGVDAGTAIFIDSAANKLFHLKYLNSWEKAFMEGAESHAYYSYIYNFGECDVAVFPSGYGDGCYSVFIGYDTTGNVCRLLCDFMIIDWWDE